jgi:hypothetical protein
MFRVVRVVAFIWALLMPAFALAQARTSQGIVMMNNWHAADRCVAAAHKQFPDYTADSPRRRDAALQQCLSSLNLPPRAPEAPQATAKP